MTGINRYFASANKFPHILKVKIWDTTRPSTEVGFEDLIIIALFDLEK